MNDQAQSPVTADTLAARIDELIQPDRSRALPALLDPAEVDKAREKFKTPAQVLAALEKMAEIRLAYLHERDGLREIMKLTPAQRESAKAFFQSHPDKPAEESAPAPVEVSPSAPAPGQALASPKQPPQPPDSLSALLAMMTAQGRLLTRMADALDQLVVNTAPVAPNFRKAYSEFQKFDWTSIGAVVTGRDGDGVSAVECNGFDYTRRAGVGKYGKAIWFSRPTGKDAEGKQTYSRLVTFKDVSEAEPLPTK